MPTYRLTAMVGIRLIHMGAGTDSKFLAESATCAALNREVLFSNSNYNEKVKVLLFVRDHH